jgi:hypothetical protein
MLQNSRAFFLSRAIFLADTVYDFAFLKVNNSKKSSIILRILVLNTLYIKRILVFLEKCFVNLFSEDVSQFDNAFLT